MFKQTEDDLCWKQNGKYCDVLFSYVYGDWSTLYDGERIDGRYATRNEAEKSLKTYVETLGED